MSFFYHLKNNMFRRLLNGNIFRVDPMDFGSTEVSEIPEIDRHEFPKFNQYKDKRSKNACTIVNAVKDLCYNYRIEFKSEYVFGAIEYAVKNDWYVIGKGRHTNKAMQSVRKYFATLWIEANYVRLRHTDPKLQEYKEKWYMIGCSFTWDWKYISDYAKDWVVDWSEYWKSFWHRTSMYWDDRIWDSEYWFKYNDYKLKDLKWLTNNWNYYWRYYIRILPTTLKKPMAETKQDVEKTKELTILENALSICRKHLDDDNQQKAHELAEYIRSLKE